MEEKVKDVYENIKDRLSNPLIFSFLCSWLVLNWKIPVALIWYDKSQFSGCGCHTIFEFIDWQWETNGTLKWPVIIAIIYTAVIPFVKNGIRIISAHAQKWGENGEIRALDGGKIGIEKYLKLIEKYDDKIKSIEKIALEENKYIEENQKLILQLNEARNNLNDKIEENNNIIFSLSDLSILNGTWKFKKVGYSRNVDGLPQVVTPVTREITIKDGKYFEGIDQTYVITDLFFNSNKNILYFNKVLMKSGVKTNFEDSNFINRLNFVESNKDLLEGKENGVSVSYERIKN
jgi:hypothetical protein